MQTKSNSRDILDNCVLVLVDFDRKKESLMILKGQSEATNQRTDNTMAK